MKRGSLKGALWRGRSDLQHKECFLAPLFQLVSGGCHVNLRVTMDSLSCSIKDSPSTPSVHFKSAKQRLQLLMNVLVHVCCLKLARLLCLNEPT